MFRTAAKVHAALAQHKVDGIAAEDGDIQLGGHAHGGHYQAAHHKQAVGFDLMQDTAQRGIALFRGQLAFCFCTHCRASPFLNWLA